MNSFFIACSCPATALAALTSAAFTCMAAEPAFSPARLSPPAPPAGFVKVYESSFEGLTTQNAHRLNWDMPHWFEFAARHKEDGGLGDGEGGAHMWVEASFARSGTNCIGLELFDIQRSRRCEFVLYPGQLVKQQYYLSCWLYIPTNWGLFAPHIDWDWYELANPYSHAGQPYSSVHIRNPDPTQHWYTVALAGRDKRGKGFTIAAQRVELPKGRWFHLAYYVRHHTKNGAVALWFDGRFIGERSGFSTAHRSKNKPLTISIAKIYHERSDTVPHQLWIDDLEIHTTPPASAHTRDERSRTQRDAPHISCCVLKSGAGFQPREAAPEGTAAQAVAMATPHVCFERRCTQQPCATYVGLLHENAAAAPARTQNALPDLGHPASGH